MKEENMKAKLSRSRLLALICLSVVFLCSAGLAAAFAAPPADWDETKVNLITAESTYDENGWLKTEGWAADGGSLSVYHFGVSTQYQMINQTPIDLTKPFQFSFYINGSGNVGGINLVSELVMYKGTDFTDVKENENFNGTDMRNHGSLFPFSGYLTAPGAWIISGGLDNSANTGNPFNISAVKDMPSDVDFSKYLTTVEMYVGTKSAVGAAEGDDTSWIKVNGQEVVWEVPLTLTRADFGGNTAYLNIQYNAVGAATDVVFSAITQEGITRDAKLPYIGSASATPATTYTQEQMEEAGGYTFSVRPNTTAASKVEYYAADGTWKAVDAKYLAGAAEKDDSEASVGYQYTVSAAFFAENAAGLYRNGMTTIFKVTYEGTGVVAGEAYTMIRYRSYKAPAFVGNNYAVVDTGAAGDIVIKLQQDNVITEEMAVSLEITDHPNAAYTAVAAENYTVSFDNNVYTITLKKALIEAEQADLSSYQFRFVRINVGDDELTYNIWFRSTADGWTVPEDRLNEGSSVVKENGYSSFDLGKYVESPTEFAGTGIFYNRPFGAEDDYTIAFEMDYPYYTCWAQFVISDTPFNMQYASHQSPTKMHMLLRGYGSEPANFPGAQGLMGFTGGALIDIRDVYTLRNKVLVEIHVGETEEEGYYKINGKLIATPAFTQADFPDGMYLSLIWNNTNGENKDDTSIKDKISTTTISTTVNGLYLKSARTDDVMVYSIGSDLEVTLGNVGEGVKVYYGGEEVAAENYTLDKASGELTVKGSYLSSLPFASEYTFGVVDAANAASGTAFTVKTQIEDKGTVGMKSFSLKNPADVSFELSGNLTELIFNEEAVAAANYTVSGQTLTLKADYLKGLASGNYVFYANVGGGYDVVKLAVGYASNDAGMIVGKDSELKEEGNSVVLSGEMAFLLHGDKDLTAGLDITLRADDVKKYYENGLYDDGAAFHVTFADVNNGTRIVYTLYANFEDAHAENWISEKVSLYGADGALIDSTSARAMGAKLSEDLTVGFRYENGKLTAAIGDLRATSFSVSTDFNAKYVSVTVESTANMTGALVLSGGSNGNTGGCSCGNSIAASMLLSSVAALLAVVVLVAKKRREN